MELEMSTFIHENRMAVVCKDSNGFFVKLYRDNNLVEIVDTRAHSEQYADDTAENWVFGYGSFA